MLKENTCTGGVLKQPLLLYKMARLRAKVGSCYEVRLFVLDEMGWIGKIKAYLLIRHHLTINFIGVKVLS